MGAPHSADFGRPRKRTFLENCRQITAGAITRCRWCSNSYRKLIFIITLTATFSRRLTYERLQPAQHLQCASRSRWDKMHSQSVILLLLCIGLATGVFQVDQSDPGLKKFVHSDTKTLQVFGIMQFRYKGESMTPYCEGVLLGSRFVLTVIACAPSSLRQKFDIDKKRELDFAFVFRGYSNSFDERDFFLTANRRYAIIYLPTQAKNPPEFYAYPSWDGNVESRNSDWHIRAEEADDYPIRLSTGYVNPGGAATTNFQNACEFTKRVDLLALKCRTDVFGKKVRSGASFFKLMQGPSIEGVAVTGLVNLDESGKKCNDAKVRVTLGLSHASAAGSPIGYLCGRRFHEDDVRDILRTMRKAGRVETDVDVFPTKTIGYEKWKNSHVTYII